jgi:hypothetical protein
MGVNYEEGIKLVLDSTFPDQDTKLSFFTWPELELTLEVPKKASGLGKVR